jgi:DDE superfamily endonuclease
VTRARRIAATRGRPLRIMFADEARFGRMNRPRPCWAPKGVRPEVAHQLIREFTYLYGAVCPKDGTSVFLILPAADTECFQIFLNTLAKRYSRSHVLVFVDGAGNHISADLMVPSNIMLSSLPAHSPELYEAHCEMWRRANRCLPLRENGDSWATYWVTNEPEERAGNSRSLCSCTSSDCFARTTNAAIHCTYWAQQFFSSNAVGSAEHDRSPLRRMSLPFNMWR